MTLEKLQVIIEAYTKPYRDEMENIRRKTEQETRQIRKQISETTEAVNRQTAGWSGMFRKMTGAIAAIGGVTAMAAFGKECIALGSDLTEVQNVVDVIFGDLNRNVDAFAKNSIEQFGLSELSAKKYMGTYGAMAKAFGITGDAGYQMAASITGLTGDIASFYNLGHDEAYTKLKSIFNGETESLKDLGVVMTQTALNQYAMNNGFGKTMANMTEQEKVMLRYQFVMNSLSDASGDFARTSGSWANQVRVLQLRFESFMSTIGQGLINAFTPVIRVINIVLNKLQVLAEYFRAFTVALFGNANAGSSNPLSAAADSSGAVADNMDQAAGAAKKMKAYTLGIDELNVINADAGDGGSGGGGSAGPGEMVLPDINAGNITDSVAEIDAHISALKSTIDDLFGSFSSGFRDAIGDTSVFDSIQNSLWLIKTNLSDVFMNEELRQAGSLLADTYIYELGRIAGSAAGIGLSIADNLIGGVSLSLSQNKERVTGYLVDMFNINAEIATISGNFSVAVADIFTVFRGDVAKQVTADIITVFSEAFMGATELAVRFAEDMLNLVLTPITDNTEGIKTTLSGLLEVVESATGSIVELFQNSIDGIMNMYDSYVDPLFESVTQGLSDIVDTCLQAFNTYILPVLKNVGNRFKEFCAGPLQGLIDKFLEFSGKTIECIMLLWEWVIKPFIEWFVSNVAPIIASNLQFAADAFFSFLNSVTGIVSGVMDILTGVLDFIAGVFLGDWTRAWEGIKDVFKGVFNVMISLLEGAINFMISGLNRLLRGLDGVANKVGEVIGLDIDIPQIKELKLPRLEHGGIVSSGQLFIANESGPEMVGRYGNKSGVMNNQQIVDAVSEGVATAVAGVMTAFAREDDSERPIEITVNMDGRTVSKELKKTERRSGFRFRPT